MEKSARAANEDYARLLARVAARGCFSSEENKHTQEDLASHIDDRARLGTDDIQRLRIWRGAYKDVFRNDPDLRNPNRFTNLIEPM
jgi:hypothetical protein